MPVPAARHHVGHPAALCGQWYGPGTRRTALAMENMGVLMRPYVNEKKKKSMSKTKNGECGRKVRHRLPENIVPRCLGTGTTCAMEEMSARGRAGAWRGRVSRGKERTREEGPSTIARRGEVDVRHVAGSRAGAATMP